MKSTLKALVNPFRRVWRAFLRWHDDFSLRHKYPYLQTPGPTDGGKVLIVSLIEWGPRLKMEGMVARSLMNKGSTPVLLSYRRYKFAERILKAFGIAEFLYFDDFQSKVDMQEVEAEAERVLGSSLTFQKLFEYKWKDIEVGRHVLSTIVRGLEKGNVSFDDPSVIALLKNVFPKSLRDAAAARLLFDSIDPEVVMFLEKGYTPYGVLFDESLRRELNTVQYLHGHKSDSTVMKRYTKENRHDHHFSLSEKSWETVKAMQWTEDEEKKFMSELRESYAKGEWFNRKFLLKGKKMKTTDEVRTQLHLDSAKKTAVIFSHVLWDATFFFGKNLFVDYEQWLVETVKVACQNTNLNWVIKLHPDYTWKRKLTGEKSDAPRDTIAIAAGVGELPPHVQIVEPDTDISTYSFFAVTDYCITVRGTIGIEASCFGIPVFTAGTGRYSGMGFTNDSESTEEYLEKMRTLHTFPPMSEKETNLAIRHAFGLFQLRSLTVKTFEMLPVRRFGVYDQDLLIRTRSLEDLQNAEDLNTFAEWVLESRDEDYLASD